MKKTNTINPKEYDDGMLPEYDFKGQEGARGKYYRGRQKGYIVRIRHEDGTVTVRHVGPAITLDPDVAAYFPDSESVNTVLRTLIALIPNKQIGEKKEKYKTVKRTARKKTVGK
jgi:hypothetical protein